MSAKCLCATCQWQGTQEDLLVAPNPFETRETLYACPHCKGIHEIYLACDEPGCWHRATCGVPVGDGYRQTCGKHLPEFPCATD